MSSLIVQMISGVVVAMVSFGFGYFLFRSQANESMRLEIYRRRLNSYEKINLFLDELYFFAHEQSFGNDPTISLNKVNKDKFVKRNFQLCAETAPYVSSELQFILEHLWTRIDDLPDTLAYLEDDMEELWEIIEKDIAKYLPNMRTEIEEIRGNRFKKNKQ